MLFREAADPEAVAVLDRMLAQVTAVVADLIAAEPGAQNLPEGEGERDAGHPPDRPDARGRGPDGGQLVGRPPRGPARAAWWRRRWSFAWLGLDRLSRGERWTARVNFAREVVDAADPARPALVALARDGERREIAFGEVADRSARLAGSARRAPAWAAATW